MFLRSHIQLGREAAQKRDGQRLRLAGADGCGSVATVVTAPYGADGYKNMRGSACVTSHYPSPSGRMASPQGHPSTFFPADNAATPAARQTAAQTGLRICAPLANRAKRDETALRTTKLRGRSCKRNSGFWQRPRSSACRPVATTWANAPSSALVPVLQPPLSLTATSARQRCWVPLAMSPIAKSIRHAAKPARTSLTFGSDRELNPIAASGCGGVFVAMCQRGLRSGEKSEGTKDVQ